MQIFNISDVFNESELPILTFVEPKEFDDIVGSLLTSGKHITLSGPSGCGKTTLAKKSLDTAGFGPGNTHWISGRDFTSVNTVEELFANAFSCSQDQAEIVEYLIAAGILILDDFHHLPDVSGDLIMSTKRRSEHVIPFFFLFFS